MIVSAYIAEEVRRQGFKPRTSIYTEMCINMALAWGMWPRTPGVDWIEPELVEILGSIVMPSMNANGFRAWNIGIRGRPEVRFADWEDVPRLMKEWCEAVREGRLNANEAYVAFEEIHPFGDGNGRSGKVLFNWLNGTLNDPVWPVTPKEWRAP